MADVNLPSGSKPSHIDPVSKAPPNQEWQNQNPWQHGQERTRDDPSSRGVSQRAALEGKLAPDQQALTPTPATTIDEILKAAYFVASGIDAPEVDIVNPHVINMHFPADGSLATIKIEARAGAWGGIGPHGSPEAETDANAHYDEMKAAAAAGPPPEALAAKEAHDDRHAREDAKPAEPRHEPKHEDKHGRKNH